MQSPKGRQEISKKELTSFYQDIILILDEEVKNNYLNAYCRNVILELLHKALVRVFCVNKHLLKEVLAMTESVLKLEHDEYFYALRAKDNEILEKDNNIAEKDNEISLLKKQIAELQKTILHCK